MTFLMKQALKHEIKKYSNAHLKSSYLLYIRANGLNETQKECKCLIINEMKKRGLL